MDISDWAVISTVLSLSLPAILLPLPTLERALFLPTLDQAHAYTTTKLKLSLIVASSFSRQAEKHLHVFCQCLTSQKSHLDFQKLVRH